MSDDIDIEKELTDYIDKYGLNGLLNLIIDICYTKVDQTDESVMARVWIRTANNLEQINIKLDPDICIGRD